MLKTAPLLVLIVFLPAGAASIHAESQTDDLADAHNKIIQHMQSSHDIAPTHASPQQQSNTEGGLPLFMSFVNRTSNELVVGLDRNAIGAAEQYMEQIQQITNGSAVPIRLVSGYFVPQSCNAVNDRCDPLIGGIEIGRNVFPHVEIGAVATPVVNNNGDLGFVMSGHVAGTKLNVAIFQPNGNHPNSIAVGSVTANPNNTRSSDSAFVSTFNRIMLEQKIFNPDGDPYDVVGTKASAVNDTVHIAGVINKAIGSKNYTTLPGVVLSTEVTVFNSIYSNGMLANQTVASYISVSGDSGAPIYSINSGSSVLLHGIHVGLARFSDFPPTINTPRGNYTFAVYSPWEHVRSELNLRPIAGGEVFDLLGVYHTRPDLQAAYPEAASGNMTGLVRWAWQYGIVDYPTDPDGPHAVLGPHAHTYALITVYDARPDLRAAYPEVVAGDMTGLVKWARSHGVTDYPFVLGPYAGMY